MEGLARKLAYIFLLGLMTYGWWKLVGEVRRRIEQEGGLK